MLALILHRNRQAQGPYPIVLQDPTAIAVCHVARARRHCTFREWAHESKNGMSGWYGFKLHVQCDEAGRLYAFDLTTATVDDRKLLDPLTRWIRDGIVVDDGGYLSKAKATELAQRGVYLFTPTRKNMRHIANPFQLARLQLRHRVKEVFAFLKFAFGAVRITRRAVGLPMPSPFTCCAVYSPIRSIRP